MKTKIKGTIGTNKVDLEIEIKHEDIIDEYIEPAPSVAAKIYKAKPMLEKLFKKYLNG